MNKTRFSAFTCKAKGLINVLSTKVKVSACKKLFSNSISNEFVGIWDTGATNTAISKKVVKECHLIPISKATVNTANGTKTTNVYLIDIRLPNGVEIGGIRASEVELLEGADLLIGMDIIGMGDLAISNYEGKTCFSFRIPSFACTDYAKHFEYLKSVRSDKIPRNELCPCGSGKKYKKCCGKNK